MEHVECNLCGTADRVPYCTVGPFQIVKCGKCGLFYTSPRRSSEEIADLYSESYFSNENPDGLGYDDYSAHTAGLKQVFADNLNIIRTYLPHPSSILDVGCAFGYFMEVAREGGWKAEGVEISAFASEKARRNTGAKVHTGTLRGAELGTASFDAVTMWDMLEHSPDPTNELIETNRILRPGGYLFITVPNVASLAARLMGKHWYGFKSAAEHNYFFSAPTIERMLENAGLNLIEVRRGVWPCSMRFLATKLAPYSFAASRMAHRLIDGIGIGEKIVRFKFIDMFVVAHKKA